MASKNSSRKKRIHDGNQFKTIMKKSPWYLFSTVLSKMASLFLMPIYTTYLSPHDYGILHTLSAFSNFLPILISLAIDSSFIKYFYLEQNISWSNVQNLYSTLFWFTFLWGIIVVGFSLVLAPMILMPVLEIPYWPFIPLTIIPILFSQLSIMGTSFLTTNLMVSKLTIVKLVVFCVSSIVTLILLISFNFGIKANLIGNAVGLTISMFFFIYISIKYSLLKFRFDWKVFKRSLIFSVPILPTRAGTWVNSLSDRLILSYFGKIPEAGLYSISVTISQMVYYINDAISQVQSPIGMSALTDNHEKGKKQISEFLAFFIWALILSYLLITLFSKEILYVFTNSRYHSAYKIVGIISFIYVLNGLYRPFMTIVAFNEKTWVFTYAAVISAISNIILNFIFIPKYGQWAAAWTTLISSSFYSLWIIIWAQKIDPIIINKKLFLTLFSTVILIMSFYIISEIYIASFLYMFLCKLMCVLIYFLPVFLLNSLCEIKKIIFNLALLLMVKLKLIKSSAEF